MTFRQRLAAARQTRTSAGDICALLAVGFTVAAVVLVRRDLRR